ncbi:MAG TPA: flagellar hook capping FlgD N-terminal domain-containing protein [Terracidiphilus sp.]|nr:flagellar hook capping FlgD N-terminal domain-containing protein [Terracidiphilus sp.]
MAAQMNPIWNQILTAHETNSATPAKSRNAMLDRSQDTNPVNGGSGNAGSDSASISANDFLTLLVTEMKNQDPTANTDPNEYINQLVQVNSLEQLISINQTLTTDSSATPTGGAVKAVGFQQPSRSPSAPLAGGNLTVPETNPAAQRVAGALGINTNRL